MDVFVLPSRREGLNLSLLTACGLGPAVVATNLRSNREVVAPGVSDLLPTPDLPGLEPALTSSRALAGAVVTRLADPQPRRTLGRAAALRTRARFGAETMTARHEALYTRLLSRSRALRMRHPRPAREASGDARARV